MDPARWETICALFHDAMEQPQEDRPAFLRAACGGDDTLVKEVGTLIEDHGQSGNFLEQPASVAATDVLGFEGARDLMPGQLFAGRYRIQQEVGRGGFGVVYRASDERMRGKLVAVKVVHGHWAASGWMRHRFEQEAEALSRIRHPGIVSATDFGESDDGRVFLVMEWVEGPTLRTLLKDGPLAPVQAATIIRAIGAALESAHAAGLLHRDLKPENVIVGEQIKLLDFGMARVIEPVPGSKATTIIAGTADYMAPEQILGRTSPASDIYSLAMLANEMITGHRPARENTPAPGAPMKSWRVSSLLRRGLLISESDRPQSALAYSTALADALLKPPALVERIGRRRLMLGGTAALAIAALKIRDSLQESELAAADRLVESPGIYPEEQYGFRVAYDIHSVIVTNEDNSERDRRRLWSGDMGQYLHPLTPSQRAQAWNKGFRLSAQLLPQEGMITALVDLAGFGPRFDLIAVRGPDGATLAGTVRKIAPLHEFDLHPTANRPPQLTRVELVMNPATKLATVSLDGKSVIEGYAGHREFQETHALAIAVGKYQSERASGVYKGLRLEIFS